MYTWGGRRVVLHVAHLPFRFTAGAYWYLWWEGRALAAERALFDLLRTFTVKLGVAGANYRIAPLPTGHGVQLFLGWGASANFYLPPTVTFRILGSRSRGVELRGPGFAQRQRLARARRRLCPVSLFTGKGVFFRQEVVRRKRGKEAFKQ